MKTVSEIWKDKGEALEAKARKEYLETGNFSAVVAENAHKLHVASERCK